jgi:hypothetical protein
MTGQDLFDKPKPSRAKPAPVVAEKPHGIVVDLPLGRLLRVPPPRRMPANRKPVEHLGVPYGPPPPVWTLPAPHLPGQPYRIAHAAIEDVLPDDDTGRCSLKLFGAPGAVRVEASEAHIREMMPWLPASIKARLKAMGIKAPKVDEAESEEPAEEAA